MERDRIEILLNLLKTGNQEALGELYDLTHLDIYRYIFSIVHSKEYAQDLTHDTYIHIYKNAKLYSGKGHAKAWLMTVSRNITYMSLRKTNRTTVVDYDIDGIDTGMDQIHDKIMLQKIMKELNEEEREIIVLHVVEGLTFKEIAEILGIGLSTTLSKYHRSLKKLKKSYGGGDNEE